MVTFALRDRSDRDIFRRNLGEQVTFSTFSTFRDVINILPSLSSVRMIKFHVSRCFLSCSTYLGRFRRNGSLEGAHMKTRSNIRIIGIRIREACSSPNG